MVQMNEQKVIQAALAATAVIVLAVPVLLFTMQTPGISRMPVPEVYASGTEINYYVSLLMPIVIVLAILFIAALSTFGLYHGGTRERLGRRLVIHRPLDYIRNALRKEK